MTSTQATQARTIGELRASGYDVGPVREELRRNLIQKIRDGENPFPGIVGYDETVLPQIENAVLAGQDIILLGERGQAKSRLARSLGSPPPEGVAPRRRRLGAPRRPGGAHLRLRAPAGHRARR